MKADRLIEGRLATSLDLLASEASLVFAAKRPTASDSSREVAFGVSRFICESLIQMVECTDSTPTESIERVCVSPSSKEQICLLCAKVVSNNWNRKSRFNALSTCE